MRGSPLIPSMGWQDFEYVVKLITAKKVKKIMASPQGEGFGTQQNLNTAPTPGGIKRGSAIPLLSLWVRVHRERGSRNTLSLCDSLVTFCSHRKLPRGASGRETLRKAISKPTAVRRAPAVVHRKNPTQNTHAPRSMNIFPALGKTVSYKALPHHAALPRLFFTGEYHGQYEPRTLYR